MTNQEIREYNRYHAKFGSLSKKRLSSTVRCGLPSSRRLHDPAQRRANRAAGINRHLLRIHQAKEIEKQRLERQSAQVQVQKIAAKQDGIVKRIWQRLTKPLW